MKTNNKFIASIFFFILIVTSCNSSLFVNKNILLKNAAKYNKECIPLIRNSTNDTLSLSNNNKCIKIGKNKFAIGSLKNGKKIGIWYYYQLDTITGKSDCQYILKFYNNKKKLLYSSGFVNEKYF